MGNNLKSWLSVAFLFLLVGLGYVRPKYSNSDEENLREVEQIVADSEARHNEILESLAETRAKIASMSTGVAACDAVTQLMASQSWSCPNASSENKLQNAMGDALMAVADDPSVDGAVESCEKVLEEIARAAAKLDCKP